MRNSLFLLGLLIFTPSLGLSEPLFFSDDLNDSSSIADHRFGFSAVDEERVILSSTPSFRSPASLAASASANREEDKQRPIVRTVEESTEDDPGALRVVRFLEEGMRSLLSYPFKPTVAQAKDESYAQDAPPMLEEIAARLQQYDERWPDGIEKF